MYWPSREECHCPSTVWGGKFLDLGGIRKKFLIRCQISRSKTRYIVFQHKSLFKLVKDLFKRIDGLGRSVTVRVKSEGEKFLTLLVYDKSTWYVSNFALKNSLYSVSTYIAFQPSQRLIRMNWGSREECHCPSTVWGGKNFWPRWYTKKLLDTLSNFAPKTRYLMFQHKSLFNLVKDLFKWIEGLERSVTVRVQSEGEKFLTLVVYEKSSWYVVKFRAQKLAI